MEATGIGKEVWLVRNRQISKWFVWDTRTEVWDGEEYTYYTVVDRFLEREEVSVVFETRD
jgi:hypothetical protein